MIGTSAYVGFGLMIAFGVLFPVAVAVWWLATRKEKVTTVLIGAAVWFVFAMVLEPIPKAILLNPMLSVGKAVLSNTLLAAAVGALLAGVFEETGRFIAFRTVLKRRTDRKTAISYGVGHGGGEALFILVLAGVQDLVYALLIEAGKFQELVDAAASTGVDVSSLQALPDRLAAVTPGVVCITMAERVSAILLHVGLSILVFYAVKRAKPGLYVLAILLHALFDVPAALYQLGVIRNVLVVEAILAVYAIGFFAIAYLALYKKDREAPPPAPEIPSENE